MAFSIRNGGVLLPVQRFSVQTVSGLLPVRKASIFTGGVLKLFYSAPTQSLSLDIQPNPTQAHPPRGSNSATVFVTATPTGGTGPFTYAWSITSFMGGVPAINTPSNATTAITQSGLAQFDDNDCTASCLVTDSLGATARANVSFTFFGPIDTGGTF